MAAKKKLSKRRKRVVKSYVYQQEYTLKAFNNFLIDNEPTEGNCAGAVCIRCNEAMTSKSRVLVSFSKFNVLIRRASRPAVGWRKDAVGRKIDDAWDNTTADCIRRYGDVRGWDEDTTEKARSLAIDRMAPFNGQVFTITKIQKGSSKPGSHVHDPVTGKALGGNTGKARDACETRPQKVSKLRQEALEEFQSNTLGL